MQSGPDLQLVEYISFGLEPVIEAGIDRSRRKVAVRQGDEPRVVIRL